MLLMARLLWVLTMWLAAALATSIHTPVELQHLTPVVQISTDFTNFDKPIAVEVELPSAAHFSNLRRRWWAQADPNMAKLLQYHQHLNRRGDSAALYSYLTKNTTLEVPGESMRYRFVLRRHEDYVPFTVNGIPLDEDAVAPTHGEAFRAVTVIKGDREVTTWKKVGWARMTVSAPRSKEVFVQGSWLVDDEHGLGSPAAIYHLTTPEQLLPSLDLSHDDSIELLEREDIGSLHAPVVWRDLDHRASVSDVAFSLLDKRSDSDVLFPDELSASFVLKRSGSDNDTSGSGFSSGQNLYSSIGDTDGCSKKREVSLMGLVADCNFQQQFNSSENMRLYVIDMVNKASRLYENAFNITLGIKELVVANSSTCPTSPTASEPWNWQCNQNSSSVSDRLGAITSWRSNRSDDGIATWSLLTACSSGGIVGLSWLGMVCTADSGAGGTNVVSHTSFDYKVLAHEVGHSFGAVHDCTSDTCSQGLDRTAGCCPLASDTCDANGKYIMNPSAGDAEEIFSPCTQGNICGAIERRTTNTTCLRPNTGGLQLVTGNVCGNGIVEEGEECDCGGVNGCGDNPCCDPTTCKFKNNAVCDDQNDQCCHSCQFASPDTVCRASTGPCDYAELCTGNSTTCPSDRMRNDGDSCTVDGPQNATTKNLQCISGHCSSRDLQCQVLMGTNTFDSQGRAINASLACDGDDSCQLSCVDPRFTNVCFTTNQNFMDGTPCRGSGRCRNGFCVGGKEDGGSGGGGIVGGRGFNDYYKYIIIGVGAFIVVVILVVGFRCYGGRSRGKARLQPVGRTPLQYVDYPANQRMPPPRYQQMAPMPPPPAFRPAPQMEYQQFWPPPPPPPPRQPYGYY